jgi:hypothetical protein
MLQYAFISTWEVIWSGLNTIDISGYVRARNGAGQWHEALALALLSLQKLSYQYGQSA